MYTLSFDYASPSAFVAQPTAATLNLSPDTRRPLRCVGRVREGHFSLRLALRAFGDVLWSTEYWRNATTLDPTVTVCRDRLLFEGFSRDLGAFATLEVDLALLELEGDLRQGTTQVDFSPWLWAALAEIRSRRETTLRIDGEGLALATEGFGGRFERRVELADDQIRSLLNVQAAMVFPGTRLNLAPVDLLAALRFLRFTRARLSPRALRYEMLPGQMASLVLEPWEEKIVLEGAEHSYTEPRIIRTWGRRRLLLLEPLLPFAEQVEVYLKGRAMPSFYRVVLPHGLVFQLAVTGFQEQAWHQTRLMAPPRGKVDDFALERARSGLVALEAATDRELAASLGWDLPQTAEALLRLGRRGQIFYELATRRFRFRQLLNERLDEARLFPPDPAQAAAQRHFAQGRVGVTLVEAEETRKLKRIPLPEGGKVDREVCFRHWRVAGEVAEEREVELRLDDTGRLVFGRCGCAFFREHHLSLGPCEHLQALMLASEGSLAELPSSRPVAAAVVERWRGEPRHLDPDPREERVSRDERDEDEEEDEP